MPEPTLNFGLNDEQLMLRDLVRDIVRNEVIPNRMKYDEENRYPWEILQKFKEAGLFGPCSPKNMAEWGWA